MSIIAAVITQVPIGNTSVEGLMTEDGTFYVGIPQIAEQFQFVKTNASREVKSLLGKEFQFVKLKTELNPKPVNAIPLPDFEQLGIERIIYYNKKIHTKSYSKYRLGANHIT